MFVEFIDKIAQSNNLLHGDYNRGNVMLCDGKYVLIDIGGAFLGHPVLELASIFPIAMFNAAYAESPQGVADPDIRYYRKFIDTYLDGVQAEKSAVIKDKVKTVAAFLFVFNYYVLCFEMPGGETLLETILCYRAPSFYDTKRRPDICNEGRRCCRNR